MYVSEIFESIQGEGITAGLPCTFLRLAKCNFNPVCHWCDSKYAFSGKEVSVGIVAQEIDIHGTENLVITGGEPLLQKAEIKKLLDILCSDVKHVEIETNGSISPLIHPKITQYNVSPKLKNSRVPEEQRRLVHFNESTNPYYKFVVDNADDVKEAVSIITKCKLPWDRVFLMPLAARRKELREKQKQVVELCIAWGLRFSPRLHIELWDGKRGV